MRLLCLLLLVAGTATVNAQTFDFQDPNRTIAERVDDLVKQMTLEEKVGQLLMSAPAIERLEVPEYDWWNECLHGVARNGRATVFPQAIALGATFDTDLMHRIGLAIADEARAKFNANRRIEYRARYAGLTFWSPNVNLFRDPRWGRGQETYGEDPFHISQMGVAFVKGLQGDHPKYLKTAAMAKHYAVHSGPEKLRHEFDAVVTNYDLWNTYLPAFESLVVDADVEGVMGAYNRTNGDPCCAHPYLMQDVLRKKWGFDGYFVSDCWAIVDFHAGHKISENPIQAAALALNTGCNLNCGNTYPSLLESVKEGFTTEAEIDKNLKELFPTRFRLGLFDPIGTVPFDTIGLDVVRSKKHIDLSYEAASKAVVLLKNKDNTLPLDPDLNTVFVTGPTAANAQALLANYYGVSDDLKTIMEGVVANVSDHTAIRYVQGGLLDRVNVNPMDWYSEEAAIADVTIACMGITQLLEGEEGEAIASPSAGDREYVSLPPHQIEFLKLMRSKAKKLVVIITAGSAISIPEVAEMADAVVYAWYPGEQGGQAVGDLLFGKAVPSGKLPVTIVEKLEDLPPYESYDMQNRTYRYMEQPPLFPFGFGLSYANFAYSDLQLSSKELTVGGNLEISATIINTSDIDADEVAQVYIAKEGALAHEAKQNLKAFKRVQVPRLAEHTVTFQLSAKDFSTYDEEGNLILAPGNYTVMVAGSAPFQRSVDLGASEWLEATIVVK